MITFDPQPITPEWLARLRQLTRPEDLLTFFTRVAKTPGPSQTVSYSRGRAIQEAVVGFLGPESDRFLDLNLAGTGNVALRFAPTPRVVFVAHADEISYLVGSTGILPACPDDQRGIPLVPFCNHNAQQDWPGSAWRYLPSERRLAQVARGTIRSRELAGVWRAWFVAEEGQVAPGDRVIYETPTHWDPNGLLRGKVDNAFGVAALLAAARALVHTGERPPVWFLFSDEEEGPPQTAASFSRAMRRLVHSLPLPPETLFVEVDGHEVPHEQTPGPGAFFGEAAKLAQGVVTPPDLYAPFRDFAAGLAAQGVAIQENRGYISRSDSVAIMERYRHVLLCGYQVRDTHYRHGWPTASMDGLVGLAQSLACIALAVR